MGEGKGQIVDTAESDNRTVGDQSATYADVQIRVETAAHQRRLEQQRLEHELREEAKDNTWRRQRELVTFAVIMLVVVGSS